MKARRTFQIAAAMLSLIYAIVLLASAVMVIIPIFGSKIFQPFEDWGGKILRNIVPKLSFLPQDGPWGGVIVAVVMLLLPAIFMLLTMLILFSKPKNGKYGLHNFGSFLGILGTLIFVVLVELYAGDLFGSKTITFMIACGVAGAFLLLFLVLGMLKEKKKVAKVEEQKTPVGSDVPTYEVADMDSDTTVHTDTNDRIWVAEPEATPQEKEETPEEQQTNKYVPDDTRSVRDIMDKTYGAPIEDVGMDNMKKIQTLRSLLDANAITKDEYIALVNAYLGVKNIK